MTLFLWGKKPRPFPKQLKYMQSSGMRTSLLRRGPLVPLPLVWTPEMLFHPHSEDKGEGSSPYRKESKVVSQPHSRFTKTTRGLNVGFLKWMWQSSVLAPGLPSDKVSVADNHPVLFPKPSGAEAEVIVPLLRVN